MGSREETTGKSSEQNRIRWEERYLSGPRPWDTGITPPEVVAFWKSSNRPRRGLAIDLGCGTGTNAAFLAGLGLDALGVDLSLNALLLAGRRRESLPPAQSQRLHFAQSDVTRLPFHHAQAVYILDVGCFHAVPAAARYDYAQGVVENLAPGGHFHLYAFDRLPEEADDPDARGLGENEVVELFTPHLSVVEILCARPDRRPCRWYLLRREADDGRRRTTDDR